MLNVVGFRCYVSEIIITIRLDEPNERSFVGRPDLTDTFFLWLGDLDNEHFRALLLLCCEVPVRISAPISSHPDSPSGRLGFLLPRARAVRGNS